MSTSQTLDLYTTIATQIRVKLLGVPPPGYLTRLQVQWVLCGLKFCLACTSMILTYLDLRRRGRRLRLVHFQRLQNGRILVLNSLFLYVLVSALSAVYFAFVRFQNWKVYYDGGHPRNLVMYTIQCWTPIYLAALVFTSGNISALLMMSRSSRGFETASRRLILAQNGTLIGVLFLYFASTLPMSIITNNRANNLIDDALTLMERLEAAGIASRAEMPVDTILKAPIGEILSQAQALQDREKGLNVWIDGLLAIAIFFCFFFACAAIASLRFVLRLRQESKKAVSTGEIGAAGSMALRSINVTREQAITIEHDANYIGLDSKIPLRSHAATQIETPRSFMPFSQALMPSSPVKKSSTPPRLTAETIALARLSRDLMMATPLVLASCFILPCCAFWGWISTSDAWAMRELQLDGLVWPELIITNALLLFFVFNHLRNPARYGSGQPEEIRTIGGRIAPPGFEFRLATQQGRTNRQSDGADEVDRVYVANLTSHDGDITLAEPEKVWLGK